MNLERRRKAAARSRIISQVYAQWAAEPAGQFTPDPRYVHDPAYFEHAPLISAPAEAQDELHRRTTEALAEAGLGSDPTRHVRHAGRGKDDKGDGRA